MVRLLKVVRNYKVRLAPRALIISGLAASTPRRLTLRHHTPDPSSLGLLPLKIPGAFDLCHFHGVTIRQSAYQWRPEPSKSLGFEFSGTHI